MALRDEAGIRRRQRPRERRWRGARLCRDRTRQIAWLFHDDAGHRTQADEAQGLYRKLGFRDADAYYEMASALRDWLVFMKLDLTR